MFVYILPYDSSPKIRGVNFFQAPRPFANPSITLPIVSPLSPVLEKNLRSPTKMGGGAFLLGARRGEKMVEPQLRSSLGKPWPGKRLKSLGAM